MKQTLFLTFFSFVISLFMSACTSQNTDQMVDNMVDKMAVVGNPSLSSNPCAAIDEKVVRLDRFTEVVKHTSAFYLEEKANAIPTPGITVSNNRRQMLKDAEKKYAEYAAERKKYGCATPVSSAQTTDKLAMLDQCTAIDQKEMRLDRFTEVVRHTSAFHLEEKANAIPAPGITVSNNRRQMLKDAEKKYVEYAAERKKYGCKAPVNAGRGQMTETMAVASKATLSSSPSAVSDKKPLKSNESTTKINTTSVADSEEKAVVSSVSESTVSNIKAPSTRVVEQKTAVPAVVHPKQSVETSMPSDSIQRDDKMGDLDESTFSSEECDDLNKELKELYEFTSMVNNTSAFHLEEKASALPSPGFTVSNNKKKMLRDAEKKRTKLLAEYKKAGCKPIKTK